MSSSSFLPREAWDLLQSYESPDATAPFFSDLGPLILSHGIGSHIWDSTGKYYIDCITGFGALPLGHQYKHQYAEDAHPPLEQGYGDLFPTTDKIEFLTYLKSIMPPHYGRGVFAVTGSQAVETALKTACLYTKKKGFLVFDGSYHGLDLGMLGLTSHPKFKEPFKGLYLENHIASCPYGASLEEINRALEDLKNRGHELAGIFVEPIQGRAGVRPPPFGWLKTLREVANHQNALLIFDEIFVGMGRCGRVSFAEEVEADMSCFGKALGGGAPISLCFGRSEVLEAWPQSSGEALHTGTFYGHPEACRRGLQVLKEILSPQIQKNIQDRFLEFQKTAHKFWLNQKPQLKIRGEGLMLGLAFPEPQEGFHLFKKLLSSGVLALPSGAQGEVLSLVPPLNINHKDWGVVLDAITKSL